MAEFGRTGTQAERVLMKAPQEGILQQSKTVSPMKLKVEKNLANVLVNSTSSIVEVGHIVCSLDSGWNIMNILV